MMIQEKGKTGLEAVAVVPCRNMVMGEINHLSHDRVLFENDEYIVIMVWANQIPNGLYEISRLREIAFRERGEGTGRSVDLDQFDLYYIHIVLWDKRKKEIAGACRIGQTDIIMKRFGPKGLYTRATFSYTPAFLDFIGPALELSKFFIRGEYSKSYGPVSMLLKGIGCFISHNPHYKTLLGAAPVNSRYSPPSQQLILSFLRKNHFAPHLAKLVNSAEVWLPEGLELKDRVPNTRLKDINKLSQLVSEVECNRKGVPLHLKHYIKMNGKIIGFIKDTSFGSSLNCMVLIDLTKCSQGMLLRCMGQSGRERFSDYHRDRQDHAA
ncbi:MAG: hypothetical protein C0392_16310 [Syntrophus sp. (in: bacteria)]|nr:hypothetical protein [Syntrophus sp. (in: bacteria)]